MSLAAPPLLCCLLLPPAASCCLQLPPAASCCCASLVVRSTGAGLASVHDLGLLFPAIAERRDSADRAGLSKQQPSRRRPAPALRRRGAAYRRHRSRRAPSFSTYSVYYTILYYAIYIYIYILCYTILCYAMLCYAMLCYAILFYIILYFGAVGSRACRALLRCASVSVRESTLSLYIYIYIYICMEREKEREI